LHPVARSQNNTCLLTWVYFFRLLCAFRGRYYSEEVDEQHFLSEESVVPVNVSEEIEDTANSSVQDVIVSTTGEKDSSFSTTGVNALAGDSSSTDDEEVSNCGEPFTPDSDSSGQEDPAGGWDNANDEAYLGRHAHADVSTSLSSTRAVFNLNSNIFLSTTAGGSFGRCFIEVCAIFWSLGWKLQSNHGILMSLMW
jgi:hypothetical protein